MLQRLEKVLRQPATSLAEKKRRGTLLLVILFDRHIHCLSECISSGFKIHLPKISPDGVPKYPNIYFSVSESQQNGAFMMNDIRFRLFYMIVYTLLRLYYVVSITIGRSASLAKMLLKIVFSFFNLIQSRSRQLGFCRDVRP